LKRCLIELEELLEAAAELDEETAALDEATAEFVDALESATELFATVRPQEPSDNSAAAVRMKSNLFLTMIRVLFCD